MLSDSEAHASRGQRSHNAQNTLEHSQPLVDTRKSRERSLHSFIQRVKLRADYLLGILQRLNTPAYNSHGKGSISKEMSELGEALPEGEERNSEAGPEK